MSFKEYLKLSESTEQLGKVIFSNKVDKYTEIFVVFKNNVYKLYDKTKGKVEYLKVDFKNKEDAIEWANSFLNENLSVKALVDKTVKNPYNRYYEIKFNKEENTVIPELDGEDLIISVWTKARSTRKGVKVFEKKGNLWIDTTTKKEASKYLQDFFDTVEKEMQGTFKY